MQYFNKIYIICENIDDYNPIILAFASQGLGKIYLSARKCDLALPYLKNALATFLNHLGASHIETAITRTLLGMLYQYNNKIDSSLSEFHDAIDFLSTTFGAWHINSLFTMESFANLQIDIDQTSVAIKTLLQILRVYNDIIGEHNVRSINSLHFLGKAYAKEKNHTLAIATYMQALDIVKSHDDMKDIKGAEIMKDLAVSYIAQRQKHLARDMLLSAKILFENEFETDHLFFI